MHDSDWGSLGEDPDDSTPFSGEIALPFFLRTAPWDTEHVGELSPLPSTFNKIGIGGHLELLRHHIVFPTEETHEHLAQQVMDLGGLVPFFMVINQELAADLQLYARQNEDFNIPSGINLSVTIWSRWLRWLTASYN